MDKTYRLEVRYYHNGTLLVSGVWVYADGHEGPITDNQFLMKKLQEHTTPLTQFTISAN